MEASAGTGKTELLCARALTILRDPACGDPAQLVAITFTEKAAAEMAARLRFRLEQAAAEEPGDERLARALEGFDRAQISTIHAFAARLLKEQPVEAGVDPAFAVAEELAADLLFAEVWDEWLRGEAAAARPSAAWRELWRAAGRAAPDKLWPVAERLRREAGLVGPRAAYPSVKGFVDEVATRARAGVARFRAVADRCRDRDDGCYQAFEEIERLLAALEARALDELATIKIGGRGNKKNWDAGVKEELDALRAAVKDLWEERGEEIIGEVLPPAVAWLAGAPAAYDRRKDEGGLLDFDDLLTRAVALVRRRDARGELQRRYRFILVDEFQDTDPRQIELVFYLAEDGARAEDWRKVELVPGKLFVVGDPKQSIYRFRRADIAAYAEAREVVTRSGGEELRLTANFRSAPRLVRFVNDTFARVFEGGAPPYQVAYGELDTSPATETRQRDAPGVWVGRAEAEPASRAEAAALLAAFIRDAVTRGRLLIYDKEAGTRRPLAYRDFALLFRSWYNVELWERALDDAGVPFYTLGGRAFFKRAEVKAVAAAARALDNPADEPSFVTALVSPLFTFTCDDLLRLKAAGGVWDYRREVPAAAALRFGDAWATFRELHDRRAERTPAATLAALFARTKFVAKLALWDGARAVANVHKVVTSARNFAAAGGVGLRAFARWLDELARAEEEEQESSAWEAHDDFVRLMTVHGAKGLEFNVVALPDLGKRPGGTRSPFVSRAGGLVHVMMGTEGGRMRTPGYAAAAAEEDKYEEAERDRILYVAATRARDLLIIPPAEVVNAGSLRARLDAAMAATAYYETVAMKAEADRGAASARPAAPPPDLGPAFVNWKNDRDETRTRGEGWRAAVAASELAKLGDAAEEEKELVTERRAGASRGEKLGRALHAVMADVNLATGADIDASVAAACDAEDLPSRRDRELVARWAREARASAPVAAAARAPAHYREVPFAIRKSGEDGVVTGRLDLLYESTAGLVVVDYKTSHTRPEAAAAYGRQLAVYSSAVAAVTGRPIAAAYLVYLPADGPCVVDGLAPGDELVARGKVILAGANG